MSEQPIELVINKEINAPIASVYEAWTQPELIRKWFGPGKIEVTDAQVALEAGGNYLISIHDADENTRDTVSGTYEEIIPNKKLVFNWMWKDGVDRTQVTVEFHAKTAESTLLTLTHRGFSQQEFADKHNMGWGACLDKMVNLFASKTAAA